jgi:hypothetical protein
MNNMVLYGIVLIVMVVCVWTNIHEKITYYLFLFLKDIYKRLI